MGDAGGEQGKSKKYKVKSSRVAFQLTIFNKVMNFNHVLIFQIIRKNISEAILLNLQNYDLRLKLNQN